MSEIESRLVKQGQWTNLEMGPVMGQTITTDTRTGTIIVALLAVLSSLGTAHLWHLLTFAYHQYRANGKPRDGLFRQQQAVLRTLPAPSTLLADSIKLWWVWRHNADKALARSLMQTLLAFLCALLFVAASISSSYVVTSSNVEVLVKSPFCGLARGSPAYSAAVNDVTSTYVRECYSNASSLPSRCSNIFTRKNIPFRTTRVACPFDDHMCIGGDSDAPAVAVDSGLIDVGKSFGLNLAKNDRLQYRKRTTCGILPTNGYTTIGKANTPAQLDVGGDYPRGEEIVYHYGFRDREIFGDLANGTVRLDLVKSNLTSTYGRWSLMSPLSEDLRNSMPGAFFETLPEMKRDDADIYLVGIKKGVVRYTKPVNDPLFSAHQPRPFISSTRQNITLYLSDFPMNMLGCTAQYQFCKTEKGGKWNCSQLSGLPRNSTVMFPNTTAVQRAALDLIVKQSLVFDLYGVETLNVTDALWTGNSNTVKNLPDDQWVREVQHQEATLWASLQLALSDYAVGPGLRASVIAEEILSPETPGEKALCGLQKMRKAGGFVNISVFGLVFIITISCVLVIADITLLKFLIFLSRFRRMKSLGPRINRWVQDGVLQLQSRAYEAEGQGVWKRVDQDIPLTTEKVQLDDLATRHEQLSFDNSADFKQGSDIKDINTIHTIHIADLEEPWTPDAPPSLLRRASTENTLVKEDLTRYDTGSSPTSPTKPANIPAINVEHVGRQRPASMAIEMA